MKNSLKNAAYACYVFLIILVPCILAQGYALGITFYEDTLLVNTEVPFILKQIFYLILVLVPIVVLLLQSELACHVSEKLKNGKIIVILIYVLYILLYLVTMHFTYESNVLGCIARLYSYPAFTGMLMTSCAYSLYNILRCK